MKKTYKLLNVALFLLYFPLILIVIYFIFPTLVQEIYYDITNNNRAIENYQDSKIILSHYQLINIKALPAAESRRMKSVVKNHETMLRSLVFYKIPTNEIHRKLLRNIRIKEFCSKEQLPKYPLLSRNEFVYLCLNDEIIKSFFHLTEELKLSKLNPDALKVNSGYRTPNHNEHVSGARNSMHLYGKALDLKIGDINNDKQTNIEDKNLVYSILDKEVIRNRGGLGFYPGTLILHMDTRGKYARLQYYKREQWSIN